jgi:hypothetical protein
MIKLVYCVTKKAGMTDDEFFHYWKNVHAPIGARIPGLRKLVQSHRRNIPGDKHRPAYDGMAELWQLCWRLASHRNGKLRARTRQTSSIPAKWPTSSLRSTSSS